jgi:trehalose-phosphatase
VIKWLLNKNVLADILHRLEAGNRLLLFLNYDALLAPTAPGGVGALDSRVRDQLRELSEITALTLILVSDQSLAKIKRLVGFSGIYFIANYGLEISGPDLSVIHAEARRARAGLAPALQSLVKRLGECPDVSLDDRGLTVAVNLSQAKPLVQRRARTLVEEAWTPVMDAYSLEERDQELVLRPRVGWTRGRAVMFLWNKFASPRRRPLVLYLGADEGEEEIYTFMGREGMGIIVGGEAKTAQSKAGYFLKNRAEVDKFIQWLTHNAARLSSQSLGG